MKQFLIPQSGLTVCGFCAPMFSAFITLMVLLITQQGRAQVYSDQASLWGIDEVLVESIDHWGSGLSFYDIDGDGWDDLTYTNDGAPIRIFKNIEGQFEEVEHNLPIMGSVKELAWFDIDNDGVMELLVSARFGKYQLFKMEDDFVFEDISEQAGLFQNQAEHYGVAIGDYDRDGFLDFYVCVYGNEMMEDVAWNRNHLYRNNGDGTFTNVTDDAGVNNGIAASFDAAWTDYNADGWPDLYVINDRMPHANAMYHNNGDGTFTDVAAEINADFAGEFPMTATIGDYNNDGALDIYLTNVGGQKYTELLHNMGDGNFWDAGSSLGVMHNFYSWGALWIDFDNDGYRDLYVATSPIALLLPVYKDILFKNYGGIFFSPVTPELAEIENQRNYGAAMGDVNNNGYPDIATQTVAPYSPNLWVNNGGNHNYVKITVTGTVSNYMAIGSWIKVYANGQEYVHYTNAGQNYVSQDSQHVLFGLEQGEIIDSLSVTYLSGHHDVYYNLSVNTHHYLTEGETTQDSILAVGDLHFCEGGEVLLDAGHYSSFLWSTGDTTQSITVSQPGEYSVVAYNEFGVAVNIDPVEVVVHPLPIIDYTVSAPLCAGDLTGSILLQNTAGTGIDSVDWNTGQQEAFIDSLPADEYTFTLVDTNGCEASGNVLVLEPLPLSVQTFIFPEFQGEDGSITLVINGGTPPYQAYLDTVAFELYGMTNLTGGIYLLTVFDTNGCFYSEEVTVESVTGVQQSHPKEVGVYPNPASETIFLKGDPIILEALVFDATGRMCMANADRDIRKIDISGLAKGQYTVHLRDAAGKSYVNFFSKQ